MLGGLDYHSIGVAVRRALASFIATAPTTLSIRSYLAGLTLSNNAGDTTNDIDIAVGTAVDSTGVLSMSLPAGLTKQLDVAWAPGNGGMRNSGAAITNTTYHLYLVSKLDGGVDIYAHTSAVVATVLAALQLESGGATYAYVRRIGSIIRSAGAILAFTQDGDMFLLNTGIADINANNPGTAAVTRTLTLPTGIVVFSVVNWVLSTNGTSANGLISELTTADVAPSSQNMNVGIGVATANGPARLTIRTNTSAQVRSRVGTSDANISINCTTLGWIDRRGRDG
jgi:hypothetical protein